MTKWDMADIISMLIMTGFVIIIRRAYVLKMVLGEAMAAAEDITDDEV